IGPGGQNRIGTTGLVCAAQGQPGPRCSLNLLRLTCTMEKTALITGASSGIGRATARRFAHQGYRLVLCGRRLKRLEALKSELGSAARVHLLCFDVRSRQGVAKAIESLPAAFSKIDLLVNNAGNAHGLDPIQDGDPEDWDAMIDINVKGLL